jgi:2-polyprenyl-3-methyl-5-hydroxy-6-metoxy-1,4-benzoquinol methylase
MSAKTVLGKQAAFYDQRWSDFAYANRLKLERCRSILSALASTKLFEPRIVDLGCGAGWLAGVVGNFGPTTGVDLSHQAVAEAAVRYPYVQFIQADILNWKYPKNSFDLVISQEIIEHVNDQRGYIEVAHGLLDEGGYLILTTPNARTMHAMPEEARKAWSNQPIENWLTISQLRSLLEERFEIISLTTIIRNSGTKGLYRVVNSHRLKGFFAKLGLAGVFNSLPCLLGYGLHIVVVGKKILNASPGDSNR